MSSSKQQKQRYPAWGESYAEMAHCESFLIFRVFRHTHVTSNIKWNLPIDDFGSQIGALYMTLKLPHNWHQTCDDSSRIWRQVKPVLGIVVFIRYSFETANNKINDWGAQNSRSRIYVSIHVYDKHHESRVIEIRSLLFWCVSAANVHVHRNASIDAHGANRLAHYIVHLVCKLILVTGTLFQDTKLKSWCLLILCG